MHVAAGRVLDPSQPPKRLDDTVNTPTDVKLEIWEDEGGRVRPAPANGPLALYERLLALLFGRFGRGARKSAPPDDDEGTSRG